MPELALFRHGEELLRVAVGDVTRIGRSPECELSLPDPAVSRLQAIIERRGDAYLLLDRSRRGTAVNDAAVTEAPLADGAELTLGTWRALFRAHPSGADEGNEPTLIEAADAREADAARASRGGPREAGAARAPRSPEQAAFEGMISSDPGMRQVFELVARVAASDAAVAVLGETGTGKELVARALHARSARAAGPFVPVNCSAIAETLIEAELFGHEKGAFSGADRLRKGAFEEADHGTIFLDEIGELPLEVQPKLLRALELGEVKRVGASRPVQVSARIVAATHRDLRAQVRAGRFREDLYYRLCVVPITVPPLRARRGDVPLLAAAFLQRAAPRGLPLRWSDEALARLTQHDWPGNVRQLRNVVQRALLFRGEGLEIGPEAVTFEESGPTASGEEDATLYLPGLSLEDIEREAIRLSLRRHHGRRAAVVRELRIAKSTVIKRIGQWGLQAEGRAESGEDEEGDA